MASATPAPEQPTNGACQVHDSPSGSNIFVVQIDKDRVAVNIFILSFSLVD